MVMEKQCEGIDEVGGMGCNVRWRVRMGTRVEEKAFVTSWLVVMVAGLTRICEERCSEDG